MTLRFQPCDRINRVLRATTGERIPGIITSRGKDTKYGPLYDVALDDYTGGSFDSQAFEHELELVARPVFMKPEWIEALEVVDGLLEASESIDSEAPTPTAIRELLAAARGEA